MVLVIRLISIAPRRDLAPVSWAFDSLSNQGVNRLLFQLLIWFFRDIFCTPICSISSRFCLFLIVRLGAPPFFFHAHLTAYPTSTLVVFQVSHFFPFPTSIFSTSCPDRIFRTIMELTYPPLPYPPPNAFHRHPNREFLRHRRRFPLSPDLLPKRSAVATRCLRRKESYFSSPLWDRQAFVPSKPPLFRVSANFR